MKTIMNEKQGKEHSIWDRRGRDKAVNDSKIQMLQWLERE